MGRSFMLIFFLNALFFPVLAQTDDESNNILQVPLFFTEANPESPAGIFSLDLPFYFGTGNPSGHQLSFGYSMGNVWNPKASFIYPQQMTARQSAVNDEVYMTLRPKFFRDNDIHTTEKTYQADGVLQHFRFTWLNRWKDKNSLILNLNLHMLWTGKSMLNVLVSDRFIENWHSAVAVEDNYGRRLYPFNRAAIEFRDEEGNVFRKEKGDVFLGVFDAHYYRDLYRFSTSKLRFSTQAAFHFSVPLNDFHPYAIPGFSAGGRSDFLLGSRSSLTLALNGGGTFQTLLKTGEGVQAIDRRFRTQAGFYAGVNVKGKRGITMIGILNQYQDPLMKGGRLDWDQSGFDEIGIRFLDEGDTWEGVPVTKEFWLAKLTPAALYSFSVKTYFILGFHRKSNSFTIFVGEDMIALNNAPDFQLGFQYRFSLPVRR